MKTTKTFFAYTPQDYKVNLEFNSRKKENDPAIEKIKCFGDRATVAVKLDNDKIKYGVAICSPVNAFNKKEGRKLAEERMNNNFGSIKLNKALSNFDNDKITLEILNNITDSVYRNYSKYKKRIEQFNKKG